MICAVTLLHQADTHRPQVASYCCFCKGRVLVCYDGSLEENARSLHWIPFLHKKWFFTSELQSPVDWPPTPCWGAVWNTLVQSALHRETAGRAVSQLKPNSRQTQTFRCRKHHTHILIVTGEPRELAISYNTQHN